MSDRFDRLKQLLSGGCTLDKCLFCNDTDDRVIIRGVTSRQTLNLPFSYKQINKLLLTYKQKDVIVIEKKLEDMTISSYDETLLYFDLSEEDTFKFKAGIECEVQLKILLQDGRNTIESPIYLMDIADSINGERLIDTGLPYRVVIDSQVTDQKLIINNVDKLFSNSKNIYKCKFSFDVSWKLFSKTVCFKDEYNHLVSVDLDNYNECYIPEQVLETPGRIYICVIGKCYDNGNRDYSKPTNWSKGVRVLKAGEEGE